MKIKLFAVVFILLLSMIVVVASVNAQESVDSGVFETDVLKVVLNSPNLATYSVGQSINLTARVSGGIPPYNYQWTAEKILNWNPLRTEQTKLQLNTSNFTFTPYSAGTYHVSLAINDSEGNNINISPPTALYFQVILPSPPTPSPSPTIKPTLTTEPTLGPTAEPTSTPSGHVTIDNVSPTPYIALAIVAIVIVVLVYFKKLRK